MRVSIPCDQRVFRDFRLFVVAALIENQGRSLYLPVIIDSGASYLTVRPDVFEQLGVAPIRETPLVTASERAVAPLGRVDRVTVGDRCLAVNVEMISIPLPEDLPAEGLLGASFLRHFLVSMDYEKGKLVFTTR